MLAAKCPDEKTRTVIYEMLDACADIPEALAVDGTLLDGSALEVTAERAEQVAEEAQKAAAGHEVFLKWLPPEAEEGQLAETFKCCGEILGDVRLKRNPQDGSCMGIGWITFFTTRTVPATECGPHFGFA